MRDKRSCDECGNLIPLARLRALPGTETCVRCSRVRPLTEADLDLEQQTPGELRQAVMYGQERTGGNSRGQVNWHR